MTQNINEKLDIFKGSPPANFPVPPTAYAPNKEATEFYSALYGAVDNGFLVLTYMKRGSPPKSESFALSDMAQAVDAAMKYSPTDNVFFNLGIQEKPPAPGKRGSADGVGVIPCLWNELDIKGPGHKADDLPASIEEVLSLLEEYGLSPSGIVHSGGGLHCYWFLENPIEVHSDMDLKLAKELCASFQDSLRKVMKKRCWVLDPTADLARMLRVPGTLNHKYNPPRPVKTYRLDPDLRYSIEDVQKHIAKIDEEYPDPKEDSANKISKADMNKYYKPAAGYPLGDVDLIVKHCQFVRSTIERRKGLSEPEWAEQAAIFSKCESGLEKFHEVSRDYPGYSEAETDKKFEQAQSRYPRKCSTIKKDFGDDFCAGCQLDSCIKSPVQLGDPNQGYQSYIELCLMLPEIMDDPSLSYDDEVFSRLLDVERYKPALKNKFILALKKCKVPITDYKKEFANWCKASIPIECQYRIADGIFVHDKPTPSGISVVPLGNCTTEIVEVDTVTDGDTEDEVYFVLKIVLKTGEELPLIRVSSDEFLNNRWEGRLKAKGIINNGCKGHFNTAIKYLSFNKAEVTTYIHTGWAKIHDHWMYLTNSGGIGEYGLNTSVRVDLSGGNGGQKNVLQEYSLPVPPQGQDLISAISCSMSLLDIGPRWITYCLLASIYLAPLSSIFIVDLLVMIVGYTGAGKSELLGLCLGHFGKNMNSRNLPGNWSSTDNSLEINAYMLKDSLFGIDDFNPTGSYVEIQEAHRKFERIGRGQGNKAGRGRLKSDLSLNKTYSSRGMIMANGETTPKGQSLLARQLVLELEKDHLNSEKLYELNGYRDGGRFAESMAGYLQWLAPKLDSLKDSLSDKKTEYRKRASKLKATHGRLPDAVGSMMVGIEMFLNYASDSGAIPSAEINNFLADAWNCISEAAARQDDIQKGECPVHQYFHYLKSAFQSGKCHLKSKTDGVPDHPELFGWQSIQDSNGVVDYKCRGEEVGWEVNGNIYLTSEAAYNVCEAMAKRHGSSLSIGPKTMNKRLKEHGRLVISPEVSGSTKQVSINGTARNVLHIDLKEFL